MASYLILPFLTMAQQKAATATKVAETAAEQGAFTKAMIMLAIILVVFVLPFFLGWLIAKTVRMRDYGWKIGLILASVFCALLVLFRSWDFEKGKFNIPLGVDLKGGVILIYEVDIKASSDSKTGKKKKDEQGLDFKMDDLVQALTNRINPSGTKEIVIRPYGERQVEIIIPEVDPIEVEHIKRLIETAGSLEFRIVANRKDHQDIVTLADAQSQDPDPAVRLKRDVMRGNERVGFWAEAAKEKMTAVEVSGNILRDANTGQSVDFAKLGPIKSDKQSLEKYLAENGIENLQILVATTDGVDVTGENLGVVAASTDEYLNPCVNFRMKGIGVQKFRLLTSENLPDMDTTPPFYRHLGIMLDKRLLSFPRLLTTISDSGRITGNFTQEEVDFLVGILRSGRLPATLNPNPISENQIGSMLGEDTIMKGKEAIVISLLAVLIFVAFYYRFSGIVACLALLANLVMILGLMVLLNAPLTLPGLAGLVLTVGMSVDANVLIFERIREELARGAALRMAIRNGFGRATTTIVDANVTTLITALVLYGIGTDQVRGFAVTLILGILMSMYTAIFCSRVAFDIAERRRWISDLRMFRILGATQFDFIGKRQIAIAGSLILIAIGLVGVVLRGQNIFDIDFTGGVSVTMVLEDSLPADEVRGRLRDEFAELEKRVQFSVNTVSVSDKPENSVYKIDADLDSVIELEDHIVKAFHDSTGKSLLQAYSMDIGEVKEVVAPAESKPASTQAVEAEEDAARKAAGGDAASKPEAVKENDTPVSPPDGGKSPAAEPAKQPAGKTSDESAPVKNPASAEKKEKKEGAGDAKEASPPAGSTSWRNDLPGNQLLAWAGPADSSSYLAMLAQDKTQAADRKTANPPPSSTAKKDSPAKKEASAGAEKAEQERSATAPDAAGKPAAQPPPGKTGKQPGIGEKAAGDGAAPDASTAETGGEKANDKVTTTPMNRTVAQLSFAEKINAPTLIDTITKSSEELKRPVPGVVVDTDKAFNWDQTSAASSKQWYVSMIADREDAEAILRYMKKSLANKPVWPSSSKIGGKVAGDTRTLAIAALLASLIGIVGYIWIRFQRVVFGVAAVIALVHDVLMTLGAIAVSAWLVGPFGFLLMEEFKISLPIVAAFLTIIGYSLNDTIVVFDRIREVRGKSPDLTSEMINTSINQTLSRTLLTSLTTLIVVVILYAIGGQGIHGFAFALVVGVVVGTYSSIYIASPALLWMFGRSGNTAKA